MFIRFRSIVYVQSQMAPMDVRGLLFLVPLSVGIQTTSTVYNITLILCLRRKLGFLFGHRKQILKKHSKRYGKEKCGSVEGN